MSELNLYWGDSHTNLHSHHLDGIDETVRYAREMLDFWPIAYYPQETLMEPDYFNGFPVEDWFPQGQLDREWQLICDTAAANNVPGEFVAFSGYEWQGNASSGDHNVFFLEDHQPLVRCDTLAELYTEIRKRGITAYAIPHHTAYRVGIRAKDWSVHNDAISPFAEIFSNHGCSESDEEWIGLRINSAMGPGVTGGTIEDGLAAGHRVGIICSNDGHHGFAGVHGWGLMGCYAEKLTRESLWEAFAARRVYGVTGDRIELDFRANGAPMGSEIHTSGPVRCEVHMRGRDAVDRIELIRNNRVISTHCHNGTWDLPADDAPLRCKLRVEAGWGVAYKGIGYTEPRIWKGEVRVPQGRIVSVEPCWTHPGQHIERLSDNAVAFGFTTRPIQGRGANQQADIFEIEARPSDTVELSLEGKRVVMTLLEAMSRSRIIDFIDEAGEYVRKHFGLDPASLPRPDRLYYLGHKAKIHRAIPESGLNASLLHVDGNPPEGRNHYRVRVTQRNGQAAWSSPVWVTNA
jgi:hypothetical protein